MNSWIFQINFYYQEDSFLWMDLIEQKIPSNQPQDYYNKQLEKINEEISNLSILKDYKSLKEQYSFFYDKLDKKKDEINKKLKYNEDEKKRKEIEKQIDSLKKEVRELKLRKEIEQWRLNYLQKLNSLNKRKSKIQEEITKIKSEIEELKKINNEDIRKILSNDHPWKNPISQ